MFVRVQKVRQAGRVYEYVHIVEGYRDDTGKVRHRVVANLGRQDRLKDSGALDNLAAAFTRLDPAPGRYLAGALPLVAPVLERLDLTGIVDRACPMRGRAHLTHGEVIAALVANRLTAPRPLYDVVDWAQTYATNDWIGVPAGLLNDDRLGRALDALSGHLDEVAGALALSAIASFGVDAARLHWDFTSVAFAGTYAEQKPAAPRIGFGHSSDHRSHRRQLKVAHATTASGIALYGRVVDGSRHEGAETNTLLETLRGLASPRRLLLVADSAVVTTANLAARPRQDPEKVSRRVAKAVAAGRAGTWLRTEVDAGVDGGLTLAWCRDEAAIAEAQRRDGLYALITNMSPQRCSADRLLALYKDQFLSERAHHFLKGPLAVRPVFLKNNERAAALVQVCSFALLVYGLVEAEVRAAIAPAQTIKALLPEGRAARPTAANIFAAFAGAGYQRARTTNGLEYIPDPITSAQAAILKALGIASTLPPQAEK